MESLACAEGASAASRCADAGTAVSANATTRASGTKDTLQRAPHPLKCERSGSTASWRTKPALQRRPADRRVAWRRAAVGYQLGAHRRQVGELRRRPLALALPFGAHERQQRVAARHVEAIVPDRGAARQQCERDNGRNSGEPSVYRHERSRTVDSKCCNRFRPTNNGFPHQPLPTSLPSRRSIAATSRCPGRGPQRSPADARWHFVWQASSRPGRKNRDCAACRQHERSAATPSARIAEKAEPLRANGCRRHLRAKSTWASNDRPLRRHLAAVVYEFTCDIRAKFIFCRLIFTCCVFEDKSLFGKWKIIDRPGTATYSRAKW